MTGTTRFVDRSNDPGHIPNTRERIAAAMRDYVAAGSNAGPNRPAADEARAMTERSVAADARRAAALHNSRTNTH